MKNKYHKTKTTEDNILDRIDEWIALEGPDCELYEYLDLDREDYGFWVETGRLS
jgi:hypothetical protein